MGVYRVDKLMSEARKLAAEYRKATCRTLAISGEIAINDAIVQLGLEPAPRDAEGYDATRRRNRATADQGLRCVWRQTPTASAGPTQARQTLGCRGLRSDGRGIRALRNVRSDPQHRRERAGGLETEPPRFDLGFPFQDHRRAGMDPRRRYRARGRVEKRGRS